MGRGGKKGVKCNWFSARLFGGTKTRNCKGDSLLKPKGKKIKFKTQSCKDDKGATAVNGLLPQKLLDGGFTSTYVFCFTTLGNGYNCEWQGVRFKSAVTEGCRGTARSANKQINFKVSGCATHRELTAVQTGVSGELAARGLSPGQVSCLPGAAITCSWIAYTESGGWTYHCEGKATAPGPEGPFEVGGCKLRAPDLAPLTANGSPRLFGVNEIWNNAFFQQSIPRYSSDCLLYTSDAADE